MLRAETVDLRLSGTWLAGLAHKPPGLRSADQTSDEEPGLLRECGSETTGGNGIWHTQREGQRWVFITTGRFSQGALKYIREVPVRIVAVDGELLTRLMIRFRVDVQIRQTYDVM